MGTAMNAEAAVSTVPAKSSAVRRLAVKVGKHFLRWMGDFQARHSRVSTDPVIPTAGFGWVSELEASWRDIRAEL